ncbi:MAG: class I SAM-dependent methyltransferase [candidate division WOR-3 bacterium]|nr:MAG: class I SAM-dependent methyltransferase [candidate division WOR-3 bacterium]
MSDEEYYMIEKQTITMHPIQTTGLILDIGGGGEGIIGRLNGRGVVAIDTRIEELAETKNDSIKIVMDANDLAFSPTSFDVATSFFSLMFIKNKNHQRVFEEIHGVLKSEGIFYIWDVRIPSRNLDKLIFGLPLKIYVPDQKIETGYGVGWDNKEQDFTYFKKLARRTSFDIITEWSKGEIFHLKLMKRVHNHQDKKNQTNDDRSRHVQCHG